LTKDDLVYVGHMLDTARSIADKVRGKSRADFDADENLRLALAHLIQVVGESARRVSEAYRAGHPQVPWRKVIGMRHRVVHEYLYVDFQIVWDVATTGIPDLIGALEPLVPRS